MHKSTFVDPSGLSADNESTALDLAVLLRHLYRDQRQLLDMTMLPYYIGTNHDWLNNNPVHREEGYLGGKHGFTDEAGRTFAGVFHERLRVLCFCGVTI
jgi:D-alanyl-D-alanine carboxypeptidase